MADINKFGFVTVVGAPNVGKSTLLNRLVGKKIAITSAKPQTTRHRIIGLINRPNMQIALVDTPGLHNAKGKALNQIINRTAFSSIDGVDVILFMITHKGWRDEDKRAFKYTKDSKIKKILLINKVDRFKDKKRLLPVIEESSKNYDFEEIIPISAKGGANVGSIIDVLKKYLPDAPPGFPADQLTDRSDRFIISELIREQVFRQLSQELPYSAAIELVQVEDSENLIKINANIWVERKTHKPIVIGKNGDRLKKIGSRSRHQIEAYLGKKVFMELWVKVRSDWSDNIELLAALGYNEDN